MMFVSLTSRMFHLIIIVVFTLCLALISAYEIVMFGFFVWFLYWVLTQSI